MPGARKGAMRAHQKEILSGGRVHVRFGSEGWGREFASAADADAFCDDIEERLRQIAPDLAVYLSLKFPNLKGRDISFDFDTPTKLLVVT